MFHRSMRSSRPRPGQRQKFAIVAAKRAWQYIFTSFVMAPVQRTSSALVCRVGQSHAPRRLRHLQTAFSRQRRQPIGQLLRRSVHPAATAAQRQRQPDNGRCRSGGRPPRADTAPAQCPPHRRQLSHSQCTGAANHQICLGVFAGHVVDKAAAVGIHFHGGVSGLSASIALAPAWWVTCGRCVAGKRASAAGSTSFSACAPRLPPTTNAQRAAAAGKTRLRRRHGSDGGAHRIAHQPSRCGNAAGKRQTRCAKPAATTIGWSARPPSSARESPAA